MSDELEPTEAMVLYAENERLTRELSKACGVIVELQAAVHDEKLLREQAEAERERFKTLHADTFRELDAEVQVVRKERERLKEYSAELFESNKAAAIEVARLTRGLEDMHKQWDSAIDKQKQAEAERNRYREERDDKQRTVVGILAGRDALVLERERALAELETLRNKVEDRYMQALKDGAAFREERDRALTWLNQQRVSNANVKATLARLREAADLYLKDNNCDVSNECYSDCCQSALDSLKAALKAGEEAGDEH